MQPHWFEHSVWFQFLGGVKFSRFFKVGAWFLTGTCSGISARSAVAFVKHRHQLYTILLLFALIWAMLIPYYSEQPAPEIILGFTGFLFWYIGSLIQDQSLAPRGRLRNFIDNVAPWLFGVMVLPSALRALSMLLGIINPGDDRWWLQLTPAITTLISFLGYYAVYDAFHSYSESPGLKRSLAFILWAYAVFELFFTIWRYWFRSNEELRSSFQCGSSLNFFSTPYCGGMSGFWVSGFTILKVGLTIIFISLLLKRDALTIEVKVLTVGERIVKLLLPGFGPGDPHVQILEDMAKGTDVREAQEACALLRKMAHEGVPMAQEALKRLGSQCSASASGN